MTFYDLQQELVGVTSARFSDAQRETAKKWINHRYSILWGMENWTFKKATAAATATASSATLTAPTNLNVVWGLWADDGSRIDYLNPQDFNDRFYGQTDTAVRPGYFTVVNRVVTLGPIPSATSSAYQMYYEKTPHVGSNPVTGQPLVNDGDVAGIPTEFHYMLVPAATSVGAIQMNDFTYQFAEQEWQNDLEALRRAYLVDQRQGDLQWGDNSLWAYR